MVKFYYAPFLSILPHHLPVREGDGALINIIFFLNRNTPPAKMVQCSSSEACFSLMWSLIGCISTSFTGQRRSNDFQRQDTGYLITIFIAWL